jgi:transcriptional regulator with XRE-family HTH domain
MARKSINAIIGEKIRELRKEQGMSQMSLAALVGVSYQQIQKYEKASGSIRVERLEQLSKAFKFPIREFFAAEKAKQIKKSKK